MLFDKAYYFMDTNFAALDEDEQEDFLEQYCRLLNGLSVSFKVLVINNSQSIEEVRRELFLREQSGNFREMIESFNKYLADCITRGKAGLTQSRIFVITCKKKNFSQARDYFASVEANIAANFENLGSGLIPMDAELRLKSMRAFFNLGEPEGRTDFNLKHAASHGKDWRDLISPSMIGYSTDEYGNVDDATLQIGGRYVRVLQLCEMPGSNTQDILQKLMAGPFPMAFTMDVAAIPQEAARKRLSELYMQNGRTIEKQQETRNKMGAWSSDVSYDVRHQKAELEWMMDYISDNDQRMFYVGMYVTICADTRRELDSAVLSFNSKVESLKFEPAYLNQIEALCTASPCGARQSTVMYPFISRPFASFTPFIVYELSQPGGIFYGINQISHNLLVGDRKRGLPNGNGIIIGLSGSGKGMTVKMQIMEIFLTMPEDDIIVIDPMNEYMGIAEYFRGQFIDFSTASKHYINPLDTDTYEYFDSRSTFLKDKTNLMLSIYSQIKDSQMEPEDNSLIGRCVQQIYVGLGQKGFKTPTLNEFYEIMREQPEPRAQALALSLELFVKGAMNMFAKPSNVSTKNRLTIYGMADIDRSLSGMGIIIMLESVRARIAENARKGKCTWVYIDEMHNLSQNAYSSQYLEKIWREVRKMGGLCTGITQNVSVRPDRALYNVA